MMMTTSVMMMMMRVMLMLLLNLQGCCRRCCCLELLRSRLICGTVASGHAHTLIIQNTAHITMICTGAAKHHV
eukprot:4668507-Karenia_brevis.AAC.1